MRYKLYLAYTKRSSEKTLGNKRKQNRYQFNYITQIILYRPRKYFGTQFYAQHRGMVDQTD